MSAQSAKKKRIGSRRRVANQSKTTEADELHIMDSVSVAQPYIPEENAESLNVLANPDNSQSESPNPPSPEATVNRRKLGSHRRNKGGQRVKDLATESYHKASEEVEEKTRDDETPQTTQMSLAIQPQRQEELSQEREHDIVTGTHDSSLYLASTPHYSSEAQYSATNYPEHNLESFIPKSENLQADQDKNNENKVVSDSCKLVETVLGGTTKSDILQCEELEESENLVGISELTTLSVLSCPAEAQQLIDQSNSNKIPEEELVYVYSSTDKESKERDEDTELLRQDGNLQVNILVSESLAESVVTPFFATPEITTDKSSPRENTKLEYTVEHAIFVSPKKELPKDEEQNEHFSLSEVSTEDVVNKVHEQEVNQKEMHEIDHSSESVTHDVTENSEIISGNLIDQAEYSYTYQSELIVKSTDDSTKKQEDSNPDDEQDEHPTEENDFEALEHTNEDYHVCDTKKQQISGAERVDTALIQVYEDEGQEGDDRKSSAEQTINWEKQGLFSEMEENDSSVQTLQSETNASLDYQPQQNDTGFNPIGNRRKLGSSRRNKGRQHVKQSVGESYHEHREEVVESTMDDKALETTEMSEAIERASQEELSQGREHDAVIPATQDSSLYSNIMPNHSSEVQNHTSPNYPEVNLESLIPTSENLQEEHDERETDFKMEVSDKSVGVTMEEMDESDTLQEVIGAHLSEDAVNKVYGQEDKTTHETDHSSESVTNDAKENSEIISENLTEQAEVRDTYQSELVLKSTDDSATKQEDSNPEQDEHPTKENNLEALGHKNDYHVDDIKSSAQTHHEKEETFSEMESESSLQTLQSEANAPLDFQPLDNSVKTEEQNDTGFHLLGNRRKLGSSRRNKRQQQGKEFVAASYHEHKEEESIRYDEALERTQMLVTIERTSEEELSHESDRDVIPATYDGSLFSDNMPESSEVLNPAIPTYPETDLESLIPTSENPQEEHDERETNFKVEDFDESVEVEGMDNFETLQSQEVRGAHHSEDAVNKVHEQETNLTQMHGIDFSSQNMLHDADDTDDFATKHEDSNPFNKQDEHPAEEDNFEVLEQTNEDYHVYDTNKLQLGGMITVDTALGHINETEGRVEDDIKPSAEQTVHQERKGLFFETEGSESCVQTLQSEIHASLEQQNDTGFTPLGNRRKLGSSRRNKGREDAKNSVAESNHGCTEEVVGNNRDNKLLETTNMSSTIETAVVEKTMETTLEGMDTFDTAQNEEVRDQVKENPHLGSLVGISQLTTSSLRDEDTEFLGQDGNLQDNFLMSESHLKSEDIESSITPEVSTEKHSLREYTEPECSVEQAIFSSNKKEFPSNEEQNEHPVNTGAVHEQEVKPTQMLMAIETTSQEELSQESEHVMPATHDSSLYSSSEVQNPNTTEAELESLIPKSENLQDHNDRQTDLKVEVPDRSVVAELERMGKSDTFQSQEVRGAHHSEDAVNKVHGQEVDPTQMHEINHSSENVTDDATENSEIFSGNPIKQAEVRDTYQSELIAKSSDDSATTQKDGNPDDKQDNDSTKENSLKVLEQTNEDYQVYDTKKQQTSGIENEDTALGQVYEIESQAKDDMKFSAEQTVQETQGLFSEIEESNSFLQTLQSESNAPLDSKPQQIDTEFNLIGNRRKLGSSRRNKGRPHAKSSVAESYHKPSEEVPGNTKEKEPLETIKISLTIETEVQEKSMETTLEGMDTCDTAQTEEVSDQVKENTHVGTLAGISELTTSNLHSSLTVDQQLIDQSNATEMPDEELPNVNSVTGKESKERDKDIELLSQDGHVEDYLVSESHLKSEDIESSITLEITTEKHSPREHTLLDCSVEQAIGSSPKEELPTNEEQNEHFNLLEVKGAQHSEDFVNKVHEQEGKQIKMQEIDHPFESVANDATENPEIFSGNLIDGAEVSDAYQSELVVRSTDDFATKQEDSNPDDKQDENTTKEDNFNALEHTNEDYHVYDTKKLQISDIERVNTALSQVYEIEGQVEDYIKPSAEQTGHQEKEEIFSETEESEFSSQTQQSDTNAPLDSQTQVDSVRTEEQIHAGSNPIANRRKFGSSRRNKGQQQVKESAVEPYNEQIDILESARGNETLETTQLLVAIEKTSQEELSQEHEHDIVIPASSLYSTIIPDSSEVQSPISTNYPKNVLESLIPENEKLQEDHDDRETDFKVEVSDKSVVAKLEVMNKSNPHRSQEIKGTHHSEDAVNQVYEQEVNPTQMHEIDHTSERLTNDATENPEIISANLINQAEVSDIYQSELVEKMTDDFATKQEDSNPDDKQDDDSTKEDNFKALEHTNEDYHVYDTNEQQMCSIESVDTALGQVYEIEGRAEDDIKLSAEQAVHQEKQGLFSEMEENNSSLQTLQSETNTSLDYQPQQNDTGFNPIGNRRKLGSSRRNKGRQHVKESAESYHRPTEDVVGNTRDNELLEITKMSLTVETAGIDTCDSAQTEEVSDHVKENTLVGTSLCSNLTVDQQMIDQSNSTEMPEQELPNAFSVTVKESNERDEDTELLSKDGNLQDGNLDVESITPETTTKKSSPEEFSDIECGVVQAVFSSPKEGLSSNEEQKEHVNLSQVRGSLHSEDVLNEVHEEAVKPTQIEEIHQTDKLTCTEESESSLQTQQSEMNAPLDSQLLDNSVNKEEKTHPGFNPTGNRRKLGSSRRNKGRQHVKDSVTETHHRPEGEFVENTRSDEFLETTKMSLAIETVKEEELKTQTDLNLKPTQKIRKTRSTVNDEGDTEKVPEQDDNTIVTRDITSSPGKDDSIESNKDINKEENNLIKEPENLSHLTGHDTVKIDSIQSPEDDSDTQNNSYHDDKASPRSVTSVLLEQEDAHEVQNTDALSCDKDSLGQEINLQQTNDAIEIVGDVPIKDYNTEVKSSMDVQDFGQGEAGEKSEDPAKKDHETQDMDASLEITHAELFATAHKKTDTLAPSDIRLKENFRADAAVDVPEQSGLSTAAIQEKTNLDNSENLQGKSKQRRRKMGSTRRTQLKRNPEEGMDNADEMKESDFNIEVDMKKIDKMEAVEKLPMTVAAEVLQNENVKPSDPQNIQSNLISDMGDLTALLPGQSVSHSEDVFDPFKSVQVADIRDRERNVDINIEPSQVDITSVQDEERPEKANVIQEQTVKSAEGPVVAAADLEIVKSAARGGAEEEHKDAQAGIQELTMVNEEVHSKNLEMQNASPNLNSPNRRRKMGSTRRSLRSRRKEEDLHQKQQVDNEATEAAIKVGDVKTESFPSIKEKEELQLHIEDKDGESEQRKEKVFETVEYSHTGESHLKPLSHQTFEENPASHGQLVEMEPHLTPDYSPAIPSTSPTHDVMSETAFGRRRKLGSHRKSRVHQNNENQTTREDERTDTQNGRDVRSIKDESALKTIEEESLGLDKISEVDESDKTPSSNISILKAGESSKPVSEKTPERVNTVQQPYAEIHLGQESQKTLSLAGSSGGAALKSKSYNVMMVGDSSVGKTSFMKRAQSGKFSLDLPASVGIDSCMWTVVVDGKPVVLQLWDTAGQERFHSITRQIFHKAQAFLLMYDITSSQSFAAVSYWANCIQEGAAENVTILLLGNKSDCAKRQVETQEGEILAKEYNFEFMECSAATGENVIQSLETVARMLSQKVDSREETTVLHKEPQQKKSSGCC